MPERIITAEYSEEMQKSYMNYSMSVITARAIPDVRDGLKPVQRRVLYDMGELKLWHDRPHRKSARIVGDTMGKYHPHGDSSIYETLVVMSQGFKKGMPLVDGHGNFGSIEGDGAAASRYTEARLTKFAEEAYLKDLDKTVDFVPNYDETEKEPGVLPARVPALLVNGAEGIAVGMSTSIPPHNLGEVIDAASAYIRNPGIALDGLMEYLKGPDFPTGGIIANKEDLKEIYASGTGKIRLRGRTEFEPGNKKGEKDRLVITEIPYTMIGAGIGKFLADVAGLAESRKLPDVTDISNQSNKEGIRIVLELRKGADADRIRNILYKKTKLEDTFGVNMLAIADGRPETLGLKGILRRWLEFQRSASSRKYRALLDKELERREVQEGLMAACDAIDLIIAVLRGAKNLKDAKACLTQGDTSNISFRSPGLEDEAAKLRFTERQASAILEMRLYKLIGLELTALKKEYGETLRKIKEYGEILDSGEAMDRAILSDLAELKAEFASPRRTSIEDCGEASYEEEKAPAQEAVFAMDRFGYCKLLDKSTYDRNRETADGENAWTVPCMTDDRICIFTDTGLMHQVKASDVPSGKLRDKGVPIENLSRHDGKAERILFIGASGALAGKKLLFATEQGFVKQVPAEEFDTNLRTVMSTKLADGDRLITVRPAADGDTAVLQTAKGYFLRFPVDEIPVLKKGARGVQGIKPGKGDAAEKLYITGEDQSVTYKEKEIQLSRLRIQKRGGSGAKARL